MPCDPASTSRTRPAVDVLRFNQQQRGYARDRTGAALLQSVVRSASSGCMRSNFVAVVVAVALSTTGLQNVQLMTTKVLFGGLCSKAVIPTTLLQRTVMPQCWQPRLLD